MGALRQHKVTVEELFKKYVPLIYKHYTTLSIQLRTFNFPDISTTSEFLEGLIGIRVQRPKDVYYVVVSPPPTIEEAARKASEINAKQLGFKASVYAPFAENPYYAVVFDERASKADANLLRTKALAAGLARDTYIWTRPSLRY